MLMSETETAKTSAALANSRRRLPAEKMPSEAEIEEFFAVAEMDLQKKFKDK